MSGLITGAAAGAAVIIAGLVALRFVQQERGIEETQSVGFGILAAAVLGGFTVASACGWLLSRGVPDLWRRGVTAMLAVIGACMLSGLAVPIDLVAGRVGLAFYGVGLAASGTWALTRARRATS